MFSNIIWVWYFIKPIIDENSQTIHALVPVGTLVSLYISHKNSTKLDKQTELQRSIENGRYKLDLFDKRFKFFKEFKEKITFEEIKKIDTKKEVIEGKLSFLDQNLEEIYKAEMLFGRNKDSPIGRFHEITHNIKYIGNNILGKIAEDEVSIATKKRSLERIEEVEEKNNHIEGYSKSEDLGIISAITKGLDSNRKQISALRVDYIGKCRIYEHMMNQCFSFMESKLVINEESFDPKKGWVTKSWEYAIKTGPKHKRIVIWLISAICVLFLSVLLCW